MFKKWGDDKAVVQCQRTIPGARKCFGVSFPLQDIIAQEISKFKVSKIEQIFSLLKCLWLSDSLEAQIITSKILSKIGRKEPEKTLIFIKSLLNNINNWAVCDTLATQGLRGIINKIGEEILPLAIQNIKGKNKWIKRFDVVTIVELTHNKKLKIPKRVFNIIKPLMTAEDSDIKKAIAWALREISKKEPEMVKNFLKEYQNSQDKNTQWIIKQGSKKL